MKYGNLLDKKALINYLKWFLQNPLRDENTSKEVAQVKKYLAKVKASTKLLYPKPQPKLNTDKGTIKLHMLGVFQDNKECSEYIHYLKRQKLVNKAGIIKFCNQMAKNLKSSEKSLKEINISKIKELHKAIVKDVNNEYAEKYQNLKSAFRMQDSLLRNKLYELRHHNKVWKTRRHEINVLSAERKDHLKDVSLKILLDPLKDMHNINAKSDDVTDVQVVSQGHMVEAVPKNYRILSNTSIDYKDYETGKKERANNVSPYVMIHLLIADLTYYPTVYQKKFIKSNACFASDLDKLKRDVKTYRVNVLKDLTITDPKKVIDYQNYFTSK